MLHPEFELHLTLKAVEVQTIFAALSEMPFRLANPVIATLQRQVLAADPTAFDDPNMPRPDKPNGAALPIQSPAPQEA